MNQKLIAGVWLNGTEMDALAASLSGSAVSREASPFRATDSESRSNQAAQLDAEFEQRLADCPMLAYRVALGVLRNTAEAEDVAQDAMVRAYRNFHRLRDRQRFHPWLVRTAWRLSLDRIRSRNRQERREHAAIERRVEPGVESLAATREFERLLATALDALPDKLRIVMLLAAIEGYNTREVANLLNLREGTVKSRLHLARKRLVDALGKAGIPTRFAKAYK